MLLCLKRRGTPFATGPPPSILPRPCASSSHSRQCLQASTTSFLLYLSTSVDTGETNFLVTGSEEDTRDQTDGEDGASSILYSVQPQRGSLLVFPHDAYHEGVGVGAEGKILLRGNLL